MCAGYPEIPPDIKFRQELGFGPIVNQFAPAPVLSAMMLPLPNLSYQQRKQVANYRFCWVLDVFEHLCFYHFLGDAHCEISCTCFQMHFRKAVLDHLPISMIEKTGTPARYMAITSPE